MTVARSHDPKFRFSYNIYAPCAFYLLIMLIKFFSVSNLVAIYGNVSKVRLNNEKLLIKKLTENYPQKFGRPLLNNTDILGPLKISLKLQLIQIVKLVMLYKANKISC